MADTQTWTLPSLFRTSVEAFGDKPALSFIGETPVTYRQMGEQAEALAAWFERLGIKPGDKIAILSHNMPNWGIAYFAVAMAGAVSVPLLPDFSPTEIYNILEHSEAKLLLISERLSYRLAEGESKHLEHVVRLDDFSVMRSKREGITLLAGEKQLLKPVVKETDLAAIIYTSGTTGKQKGVMLSQRNITTNADAGGNVQYIDENDVFLSILPLSHVYENTLGLVLAIYRGARVEYFRQLIAPQLIAEALKQVRPTILLSVPLIIEKIYRSKILPGLKEKKIVWKLYQFPPMRKLINKKAGKKLYETFGGRLRFFGVGGAKLDARVEQFLLEAGFPVAIGYGLTESSPLLAGTNPQTARLQTTGPAVNQVELKLMNIDPLSRQGEIWAKGPNIMLGYYKDPVATAEVLTPDGWLKTGDLGAFDNKGYLFIKGRLKNTILGANGENIYPEEIETLINNFRHVVESVVVEQKGKLVALVHVNKEEIEAACRQMYGEVHDKVELRLEELKNELRDYVNSRVKRFSQVHAVEFQEVPFQKTATQKIKRYLYFLRH